MNNSNKFLVLVFHDTLILTKKLNQEGVELRESPGHMVFLETMEDTADLDQQDLPEYLAQRDDQDALDLRELTELQVCVLLHSNWSNLSDQFSIMFSRNVPTSTKSFYL